MPALWPAPLRSLALDFEVILAPNPGPMTLEGTNTYVVGRDPAVVIDPGPADEGHIAAVRAAADARGGTRAVLLTHSHRDHSGGVEMLGVEVERPADGEEFHGLRALATPGHAADHVVFVAEDEAFVGDLVAGYGSTIVPPREGGGSLADYMESLRKVQALGLKVMHPGHGPDIDDPAAKIAEYLAHRQEREDKLVAALESGERDREKLLATVWDDVPESMRGMAGFAMQAHLEKLEGEGRLPDGVG
jgi:glyoxylase-like metal-dependent hydrolase (beta-lactamase superfamily II)